MMEQTQESIDKKGTLKAKIEAKRLARTNKTVRENKIEKIKQQADKDIKSQLGSDVNIDINNLMSSFMKKL